MTKETCKTYYETFKKRGDVEQMEFWKNRFVRKGGDINEIEPQEVKSKKEK